MAPEKLSIIRKNTNRGMKKAYYSFAAILMSGCVLLSSCMTPGTAGTTTAKQGNTSSAQTGAAITSALLAQQGQTNSTAAAASQVLSAVNSGSLISGIVGLLTGGSAATSTSIVGTWTYVEPTVQFQSENLLAQAGGVLVAQKMVSKLAPYYEKFGFKSGAMKMTFAADKSCTIVYGTKTITGTYTYDPASNVLNMKGQFGLINVSAFVTLSANQLALTFDSSKLLALTSVLGGSGATSQTSAISQLASSYTGMKTGFLLTR